MKTFILIVIMLLVVGLAGCSDKNQSPVAPNDQTLVQKDQASLEKPVITRFTVTQDYPVELLSPGEVKAENGIVIMRNVVTRDRYVTSTPLVTGYAVNTVNLINSATTRKGIVWGTFVITPEASEVGGGRWDCVYSGITFFIDPSGGKTYLHGTGRGVGGTINGMIYNVDLVIVSPDNPPTTWQGSGSGFITAFQARR